MRKTSLLWVLPLVLSVTTGALAYEDEYGIERAETGDYPGAVTSVDAMQLGQVTGSSLALSAEHCLRKGQLDKAIKLCQLAIDKDLDNIDTHLTYAEALEKKISKQQTKDNELYKKCIKEWLIVYRGECGDEKGLSNSKGLSIPVLNKFYEDEDRTIPARQRLMALTGHLPKPWETDQRFINRVCKPAAAEVSGKVLKDDKGTKAGKLGAGDADEEPQAQSPAQKRSWLARKLKPSDN